jgi:hypothetical protein
MAAIRLYWRIPPRLKRQCLFHETCSRHVYRATEEGGTKAGLLAFAERARQCRPGYSAIVSADGTSIRLADGKIVALDEMNVEALGIVVLEVVH